MRRYSHGEKISKNQKMYPHHFGCSQNGGGTLSDFLIFFSPFFYLLTLVISELWNDEPFIEIDMVLPLGNWTLGFEMNQHFIKKSF